MGSVTGPEISTNDLVWTGVF